MRWPITLALLLGSLAGSASAQEMDPKQEQARQLVERIRRSMREIDNLLLGASGEEAAREIEETVRRMDQLLREAESKSEAVVGSIDKLIEMAEYQQQQSSSSSSGQDSREKDQQQGQQPRRERSEDPQQLQQQRQEQDSRPQQESEPNSPRPDEGSPEARDADRPPPRGDTGEFERVDTTGRWGLLPPKEAEDLQRYDVDDFPQRYRHWMELYYRRVNRLRSDR